MASIWVESLGERFSYAFDLLEGAVRDCTDELWRRNMWEVPDDDASREVRGPDGGLMTDPVRRHKLLQRDATPWGVAWHALERLDFLLTGGFVPWEIWPPLAERLADGTAAAQLPAAGTRGHTGLDISTMSAPWTRSELLAYSGYCRHRAVDTLRDVTDERAAMATGRKPYAARLLQANDHLVEHASQIRQFITMADFASHVVA